MSNKWTSGGKLATIKQFIKKKPVRLILALIVIAAIMTGVSFGIIAILKLFKNPCSGDTQYNSDLKLCVPSSCPDSGQVCTNPDSKQWAGKCVPSNYCDYTDDQGNQYVYDPESCECTIKCASSGSEEESPFTKEGNPTTPMQQIEGIDKYKPVNDLTCGISCDLNKTDKYPASGGIGWCKDGYLCGQYIDSSGKIYNENLGCYSDTDWKYCSDGVVCPIHSPCKDGKCQITTCGDDSNSDNVYACTADSDCDVDGKTDKGFKCLKPIRSKFEKYKKVGYCKYTNQPSGLTNCMKKQYIGEDSKSKIVNCSTTEGTSYTGISAQNQCDKHKFACAPYGICPNEWQGKFSSSTICSSESEVDLWTCCDKNNRATAPDGTKFCCPIATKDGEGGECTLNTEFAYDFSKMSNVVGSLDENHRLTCTSDADCVKNNQNLWSSLGQSGNTPYPTGNETPGSDYASLYCDTNVDIKGKNYCKAACGIFDSRQELSDVYKVSNYDANDPDKNNSYCWKPDNSCTIDGFPTWNITGPNPASPICKSDSVYAWSASKGEGYLATATAKLSTDCKSTTNKRATCNNVLSELSHINEVTYNESSNDCEFTAACDQLQVSHGSSVVEDWSSLKEPEVANKLGSSFFYDKKIIDIPGATIPNRYYYYFPFSDTSVGDHCYSSSSEYNHDVLTSPFQFVSNSEGTFTLNDNKTKGDCVSKFPSNGYNNQLNPDGTYQSNVEINQITGQYEQNESKEKFADVSNSSNSSNSSPTPIFPTNSKNWAPVTAHAQLNGSNFEPVVDNLENKTVCAYLGLKNGHAYNNVTTNDGSPQTIVCKDNEFGYGNINCYTGNDTTTSGMCCKTNNGNLTVTQSDSNTPQINCPKEQTYNCYSYDEGTNMCNSYVSKSQCDSDQKSQSNCIISNIKPDNTRNKCSNDEKNAKIDNQNVCNTGNNYNNFIDLTDNIIKKYLIDGIYVVLASNNVPVEAKGDGSPCSVTTQNSNILTYTGQYYYDKNKSKCQPDSKIRICSVNPEATIYADYCNIYNTTEPIISSSIFKIELYNSKPGQFRLILVDNGNNVGMLCMMSQNGIYVLTVCPYSTEPYSDTYGWSVFSFAKSTTGQDPYKLVVDLLYNTRNIFYTGYNIQKPDKNIYIAELNNATQPWQIQFVQNGKTNNNPPDSTITGCHNDDDNFFYITKIVFAHGRNINNQIPGKCLPSS